MILSLASWFGSASAGFSVQEIISAQGILENVTNH